VWFLVVGVSYEAGRTAVALFWAVAGVVFYRLNRELGVGPGAAYAAGLVLITTPQLAIWSRDTMSDLPSLTPLFGAAWFWLRWLRSNRPVDGVLAFVLAEVAFFFRVTTAGALPGLLLFALFEPGWTRRRVRWVVGGGLAYLVVNAEWVAFAATYSSHELTADGKGSVSIGRATEYFVACLPGILSGGTAALAAVGLVAGLRPGPGRRVVGFWLAWLASYTAFKIAVPTSDEVRHFLTAVPAFAGLAAVALPTGSLWRRVIAGGMVAAAVAGNLYVLSSCPLGVVGYRPVGELLARSDKPGNVLLACHEDQYLIFRYRASDPICDWYLIRSDRTLAVRVSDYAGVAPRILATTPADVIDLIRKGKVRYVVVSSDPTNRPQEMRLVDETVRGRPELFRPVDTFPLLVRYVDHIHASAGGDVRVWEFLEPVSGGPPDISVVIPTAGLVFRP
jgi:hypothetical protein